MTVLNLLDLYGRNKLIRMGYRGLMRTIWSDDHKTAWTDGIIVGIPSEFCGHIIKPDGSKKIKKSALKIARGLMLHETGHFTQPMKACAKVANEHGLPHQIVNVLLDIHLESCYENLFPDDIKKYLKYTRLAVKRDSHQKWFDEWQDKDFTGYEEEFMYSMLMARFASPNKAFVASKKFCKFKKTGKAFRFICKNLCNAKRKTGKIKPISALNLPKFIELFCDNFPELCQPLPEGSPEMPGFGISELPGGDDGDDDGKVGGGAGSATRLDSTPKELVDSLLDAPNQAFDLKDYKAKRGAPVKGAALLAQKLQVKFTATPVKKVEYGCPEQVDRRNMMLGRPDPTLWFKREIDGKENIARHAVVALDCSGSMTMMIKPGRTRFDESILAVQAMALALRNTGGSMTGVVFSDEALIDSIGGDSILFDKEAWQFMGGTFKFLPELWRRYPNDKIIVLTDGQEPLPDFVLQRDAERTYVIMIGDDCSEHYAMRFGTPIKLNDISELPDALFKIIN